MSVSDIADILKELSCPLIQNLNLNEISLVETSQLLNWISLQLQFFAKTDSIIQTIKADADFDSLNIELNSLLNELDSIYIDSSPLEDVSKRHALIFSLAGDLLAARVNYVRNFDENLSIFTNKLNPKNDLKIINNCLSISTDFKNVKVYFDNIKKKLDNLLKCHEENSLLLPNNQQLNSEQWNKLKKLNEALMREFFIRRQMLTRRADMTVNSFHWNEENERNINEQVIKAIYNENRKTWTITPNVTLSHALASRSSDCDSLINKRISLNHASCFIEPPQIGKANMGLQQRLQLHKFLIGSVPDRGGRPYEQPPPPRETFSQQQTQRDRGGGRGGGGGYQSKDHQRRNYHQSDHQQNRYMSDNFGGRVQNAGWQQQGQMYQYDNYQQDYNQQFRRGGQGGYQRGRRGGGRRDDYYYH